MSVGTTFLVAIWVALMAFVGLNWSAFAIPSTLSLGFTFVEAPLGLVLLGILVMMFVFFLVFALYLQAAELVRFRGHAKALDAQRKLAERAEESRITALQTHLDAELMGLRLQIEEATNSLSAHLGEIEDGLRKDGDMRSTAP